MRRHAHPTDRTALLGSAAVHVTAVVLAFLSTAMKREPPEFVTYEIELVSPPPAVQRERPEPAPPEERLEVDTPEPARQEAEPEPEPVVEEKPQPKPEKKPEPEPAEKKPEPKEEQPKAEPAGPEPEKADVSGQDLEVRMEGLKRDFPVYYRNIVDQINRCFRPPQNARGEAVVQFYIRRDGRVDDLELVRSSGSTGLDLESIGAVECAGRGRFGPLPDEMPYDRLPVRFRFTPSGEPDPPA